MRYIFSLILILLLQTSYSQKPFKVGVIEYKSAEKVMETFGPMGEFLSNKLGRDVEVEIVADSVLRYKLHRNEYDMGIFKPFEYMKARDEFEDLTVFATHEVRGVDKYYGYILVRDDSEFKILPDLQGTRFLFIKPNSTSGFSVPKGVFSELEIDIEDGFFDYGFSYDHQLSLDSMLIGGVEGIAISSESFGTKEDMEFTGVRVLSEVEIPYHGYVFAPALDSLTRQNVKNALFTAKKNPENRDLLKNPLHVTGWVPKNDSYYNQLRRYFEMIRVKPTISIFIDVAGSASNYLNENGDALTTIPREIRRALLLSDRFSKVYIGKTEANHELHIQLSLKNKEKSLLKFSALIGEKELGSNELIYDQLEDYVPALATMYLLQDLPVIAKVLTNGKDWFVSYGKNDGITSDTSYVIKSVSNPEKEIVIKKISDMNTYLEAENLTVNEEVLISYTGKQFEGKLQAALGDVDLTTMIFSDDNIWDKIGLFGGLLIGLLTTSLGWYFNTRKKRHFKTILTQTNNILKDFYDDQYKTEARMLEIKDNISKQLEKGQISENQFLILKHKIDEVEAQLKVSKNIQDEKEKEEKES